MRGLVLLAQEGINGTVCGLPEAIGQWKSLLIELLGEMSFNDSESGQKVFPRWLVKIRKEIVTLRADASSVQPEEKHLTPEQWEAMMANDDVVVLDARNDYETEIGMFEKAIDPKITTFTDFKSFAAQSAIPKDKKVLMYCTGGIRCEKASVEMEKRGYKQVYQLKGGILAYLKKFPDRKFNGECFVFDHRVAVGQRLEPSATYGKCPHCGDPADRLIDCGNCGNQRKICRECVRIELRNTCSKNCRYRLEKRKIVNK